MTLLDKQLDKNKKPHPVDQYVGSRLRMQRLITGMSQEKLGSAIGLTFQQIQKYERGANRIGSSRLYELSKILGVSVGYFFDGYQKDEDDNKTYQGGFAEDAPAFDRDDVLHRKETADLLRVYYAIPDENIRRKLFDFAKVLAPNS